MSKKKLAARPALALDPTLGMVDDEHDAYITLSKLRTLVLSANRWWTFHGVPTTVELPGGKRYAKLWDRFTDHGDAHAFAELLREYRDAGVPRPGGYADVFHSRCPSPRVPWSVNSLLAPAFAGGWQQALQVGVLPGTYYKYDIRSAYLWAGSLGMPDPTTYVRSTTIRANQPGIFRVKLEAPVRGAPFPFYRATECLASANEIEEYQLPVKEVVSGVTWTRDIDPSKMIDAVQAVSTWKQAGRSYWGRWGQSAKVECHAGGKVWTLPNVSANIPWAHLIISRVKSKLWSATDKTAAHVYVDSIITKERMTIGDNIGDWKLERIYNDGIIVRGPGQYGDATAERLERMAGRPKDSPLRDILANKYLEELLND